MEINVKLLIIQRKSINQIRIQSDKDNVTVFLFGFILLDF